MPDEATARIAAAAKIENFGEPLRVYARDPQHAPPLPRARLTQQVAELISARHNVLLVGESGVGKTYLVRSLPDAVWPLNGANQQMQLIAPHGGAAPEIIETTAAKLMAGCHYVGDLETKLLLAFAALRESDKVLFIENVHECCGMGASHVDPYNDVASVLQTALDQGMRVVCTTTSAGRVVLRARRPELYRRFIIVDVPEPDADETAELIEHHLAHRARHGAHVAPEAGEVGQRLVRRYLPGQPVLAAFAQLASRSAASDGSVNERSLRRAIASTLGVRECFVGLEEPPTHRQLVDELERAVFGQPDATRAVADAVLRYSTGLKPAGEPVASLLLVGPSGVGKTTLALAAARILSGSDRALIRFDMSEFADFDAADRLIEDSEQSLVGRLLAQPAGVLLLDEIEKAHPTARLLLLQALGEARLTSASGRTARLDNHLVMLTSNVGSRRWGLSHPAEKIRALVLCDLAEEFPIEFLGRVRTVMFEPLSEKTALKVALKELYALNGMAGLEERELQLIWTESLVEALARAGVSRAKGARGMQAAVQTLVVSPLARWLAENPEASRGLVMLAPRFERGEMTSLAIDWASEAGAAWEMVC